MTVTADALGVLKGKFRIPAGVTAGTKRVQFIGSGGSYGEASFTGQGQLLTETRQQVTQITEWSWWWWWSDPLAQTFTPDRNMMISSVDLMVGKRGPKDVLVQIRQTTAGVPNRTIMGEGRLSSAELRSSGWTRFELETPCRVDANTEYAIVVLTDDAETEIGVAELGKWDQENMRWITAQPYQVGVLLSSSNASTWTPHQDRDMTFRLNVAEFIGSSQAFDLGTVAVTGATDLVLLPVAENATADARVEFSLTMPDGSTLDVADGQQVQLTKPVTGNVGVRARIRARDGLAGKLYPGTALVTGAVQPVGTYSTRAIAAGQNSKLTVVYEALIPSGATVTAEYQAVGSSNWTALPNPLTAPGDNEGFIEFTHTKSAINDEQIRVRLTLTGSAAARPRVRNLRVLTT